MIERLRVGVRNRPLVGITLSVLVHVLLVLALFWVPPGRSAVQKRGDALIVELPDLQGESGRGTPGPAAGEAPVPAEPAQRSEEHTSELQSHSFISYAVFCLE